MSAPDIAIFTRHSKGCKHETDEAYKRCACRKWLRWTQAGKRHRIPAETRSWAAAEEKKRTIEDQLSGRSSKAATTESGLRACIDVFLQDKRVQGVAPDTLATYRRELERLAVFCDRIGVYTVQGLTRENLTRYAGTWDAFYKSSVTRSHVRERCRGFLRYCYEAEWLPRIPLLPKVRVDAVPTLPLTSGEFDHLLASIPMGLPHAQAAYKRVRVRALFLLMRWSGLAIRDALSLKRSDIRNDQGFYRVVTKRQKTGTDVSVPIPPAVALEVLAAPNKNAEYIFWTGDSKGDNHTTKWQTRYIAPVFKAAGLYDDGHMVSHRLRDTFAVSLLEKGVPMEEVSKLLGHESIKTTEKHYAKWVQGRQDRLDALVTGTWEATA